MNTSQDSDFLQALVESADAAIAGTDAAGNVVFWNRGAEQLFGYTREEMLGTSVMQLVPERYREEYHGLVRQVSRGECIEQLETTRLHKSGQERLVSLSVSPVRSADGALVGSSLIARDVGERRRLEAYLAALVESSGEAIIGEFPDGTIRSWNSAAERIYGYSAEEVIGRSVRLLVPPEREQELERTLELPSRGEPVKDLETERLRKGGEKVHVSLTVWPVLGPDGATIGLCSISRDIGEALRLREALERGNRLQAMGRLVGGIVHDFNNLLTVIGAYAELTLGDKSLPDRTRADMKMVNDAVERASGLSRQLLAFARRRVLELKVVDLTSLLAGLEPLFQRTVGEDVELSFQLGQSERLVLGDYSQLEQVVLNLVLNARDAMPTGGRLDLVLERVELDEVFARQHDVRPGEFARLSVTDTGVGMDAATQGRVFDPFFTTKPLGKGTGLGLATAYGIVRQLGGAIMVFSEVGYGSTFRIFLPLAPRGEVRATTEGPRSRVHREPTETVLVVDDDNEVRGVTRRVLGQAGYTVLEAEGPGQALLMLERHAEPIHLLLTDVVMPHMSGRELSDRAMAFRPALRVCFMSGFTDEELMRHGPIPAGTAFIEKPFSVNVLLERVREVLDSNLDSRYPVP